MRGCFLKLLRYFLLAFTVYAIIISITVGSIVVILEAIIFNVLVYGFFFILTLPKESESEDYRCRVIFCRCDGFEKDTSLFSRGIKCKKCGHSKYCHGIPEPEQKQNLESNYYGDYEDYEEKSEQQKRREEREEEENGL